VSATPTAVRLEPAWGDPDAVLDLLQRSGPYLPLARNAGSKAERRAVGAVGANEFVPPWFRLDLAIDGQALVDDGDRILHHEPFVGAARQVFGGDPTVEPTTVYVNVMVPCSYPFAPHLDVPAFRGRAAGNTPAWFLKMMHASDLFEVERIRMATAVSWFFDGPGGDFHYWADGPDGVSSVERSPYGDVAIVADNEVLFHGVGPVGDLGAPSPTDLTLDAEIAHGDDGWTITDGADDERRAVVTYPDAVVRITTSWKGRVYANEAEQELVASGAGDLSIEDCVGRLVDHHGIRPTGDDPLADQAWIDAMAAACPHQQVRIPRDA